MLHGFDLERIQGSGSQPEIGQFNMTSAVDQKILPISVSREVTLTIENTHFRLEIAMDVTEFMEFVDSSEHFSSIKSRMFLLENPRVVE